MKSFLKYSTLAFASLIISGSFVACGEDDAEAGYTTPYTANTANLKKAGNAVDLGLSVKWADMNVGAASESDNGLLFSWGDVTGSQIETAALTSYLNEVVADAVFFNQYKCATDTFGFVYDTTEVYLKHVEVAPTKDELKDIYESLIADNALLADTFQAVVAVEAGYGFDIVYNTESSEKITFCLPQASYADYTKDETKAKRMSFGGKDFGNIIAYNVAGDEKIDPATANWGKDWRIPTKEEIDELISKCTWEFSGNGYKVTGPNGNSIFLPAAGYRYGNDVTGVNVAGYYISMGTALGSYHYPSMEEQAAGSKGSVTPSESTPTYLVFQNGPFNSSVNAVSSFTSDYAVSVRPVTK